MSNWLFTILADRVSKIKFTIQRKSSFSFHVCSVFITLLSVSDTVAIKIAAGHISNVKTLQWKHIEHTTKDNLTAKWVKPQRQWLILPITAMSKHLKTQCYKEGQCDMSANMCHPKLHFWKDPQNSTFQHQHFQGFKRGKQMNTPGLHWQIWNSENVSEKHCNGSAAFVKEETQNNGAEIWKFHSALENIMRAFKM